MMKTARYCTIHWIWAAVCLVGSLRMSVDGSNVESRLILLQTLSRHGDRTPSYSYFGDPYKSLWTQGKEELTDTGIVQLVKLGHYFRKTYRHFIPINFHKDVVYVRSTDTDRTLMSAASCMNALFPSRSNNSAIRSLGGQILPIHSTSTQFDQLLKESSPCPTYDDLIKLLFQSPEVQKEIATFSRLLRVLGKATGHQGVKISLAWKICDMVTIWALHNLTLPAEFPPWTVDECTRLLDWKHTVNYASWNLTRLRGGPLVGQLLSDMRTKVNGENKHWRRMRLISYFAHDSTLAAVMSHLGVHNRRKPPLASSVVFELYEIPSALTANDRYLVRFLFRNSTNQEPHVLIPFGCGGRTHCPLQQLEATFAGSYPNDVRAECGVSSWGGYRPDVPSVNGVWILLFSMVMIVGQMMVICFLTIRLRSNRRPGWKLLPTGDSD